MFRNLSIKGKAVTVIMLTTIIVLLLTVTAFTVYDILSFRRALVRNLEITASITAENSNAVLTFEDEENAERTLAALKADPHITAAALYDAKGNLFVRYPHRLPAQRFPVSPGKLGHSIDRNSVSLFQAVLERDGRRVGTLYVESDLGAVRERFHLYVGIATLVLCGSVAFALILSNALQRRITSPILSLANSARVVSERGDYSLRVPKASEDELGILTDAFNLMLERVQQQTIALSESEEKRRLSLEAARIGTWDWNLRSKQMTWDEMQHSLFNLGRGGFKGTFEDFLDHVHESDRPMVRRAIDDAIASRRELLLEFRIIDPDGGRRFLVARGKAIYSQAGEPLRFIGVMIDATDRRLAEEARSFLAAIVSSSDEAIIGKDLESHVVSWNAGAEKMFGYTEREMLGQPITRILRPDRPDEESVILAKVTGGQTHHFETVRICKDGAQIDVSVTVSPVRNARGEIIGVSSISRDITEAKRIQEEVRKLNAELEVRVQERTSELTAANQEMEAFTYSVAHDLRAPLRHIDAFTRILVEDFAPQLPHEARRYLDNIRNGSRNMSRLVDDLLNLARIGRAEIRRQPVAAGNLVADVIRDMKGETEGRKIEWRVQQLPVIQCDPGLMKQVFINLLSNAVKYTRPRQPAIIEVGATQNNGKTALYVRDNGVGFSMKYSDKLFGVFQRLHRAEEFEGTGVGLATVDRIIRKHGGRVWANAELDKGATFYFTVSR